jgi:hypothetical protein
MTQYRRILFFISPVLLSFLLHLQIFKLDVLGIHVWRQSQTQTVIYNFTFSDNNILHPQRFDLSSGSTALLYEFPLYQWLVAQINHVIGYSVLNTRLFTFVCFVFLMFGFYKWMRLYFKEETSRLSTYFLCFSPLLYYYCVNPLPDILGLAFTMWFLFFSGKYLNTGKTNDLVFASVFLMLAALIKLPFILFGAVLIPGINSGFAKQGRIKGVLRVGLILGILIPVGLWYTYAIPSWKGNGIISGVFGNDKSAGDLLKYFWFHLVSTFPELISNYAAFPLVVLGLFFGIKSRNRLFKKHLPISLAFLAVVVYFIFELNMIEKSHDYYLLPFVPFIFLLLAYGLDKTAASKYKTLIFLLLAIVPIAAYLRIQHRWDTVDPGFNSAYLYEQQEIQSHIPEKAICIVDHDNSKFIALYYLKRNGFSLHKNELSPEKLKEYIIKGASVLITENPEFRPENFPEFGFEEVYTGGLKIYKIQQP